MNPVIEVKNIGKSYQIAHQSSAGAQYETLKDDFAKLIKKPFGGGSKFETFWALNDVSFTVNEGETFGIIGKNGSGKSTLLKILSRIVDPTAGNIEIRGKVASLLEVGTGFHPELTGRENIFFNGSMIGMSKEEITKKFDEIVAFSGVEKFLDTPVKFYSSGMYVRLAFSVAAHLDADILILDEVLAVGDAQFQKKSMDKLLGIAKGKKTILFVSHSMAAVEQICSRAMLLDGGKVKVIGDTETVTEKYLTGDIPASERAAFLAAKKEAELAKAPPPGVRKSGKAVTVQAGTHTFSGFKLNGKDLNAGVTLNTGEPLEIETIYSNSGLPSKLLIGYGIRNEKSGDFPIYAHNELEKAHHTTGKAGTIKAVLKVPKLAPGNYGLDINVWLDDKMFVESTKIGTFSIDKTVAFAAKESLDSFPSSVLVESKWDFSEAK